MPDPTLVLAIICELIIELIDPFRITLKDKVISKCFLTFVPCERYKLVQVHCLLRRTSAYSVLLMQESSKLCV